MARVLVVAVVVALTGGAAPASALLASAASAAPLPDAPVYDWPVPGAPVAAFVPPRERYGPGHRGVDLPVEPGQPVHPMADGIVVFSGPVAGDVWTTVQHADGVATTYGPMQLSLGAPFGAAVTPDDVIGRARGDAHGHAGRLHVGARRDGRYVDPARLIDLGPPPVATLEGPGEVLADPPDAAGRRLALVPGTPPSPNHVVVLPGLTSSTGTAPFRMAELGYGPDHWQQFSYLGVDADGEPVPYDHEATWGRVHDMALALRDQLRAHAAANPGQGVDLVGHSLGGLVGLYYLLVLHDASDPTLPPIGNAVTVASPLGGTDSANAVDLARDTPVGRVLLALVEAQVATPEGGGGPVMHQDMPVLDDLQTDSEVVTALREAWQRAREDPWSSPLAIGTDVLTIGSTLDPIVNEHRSRLPDDEHRTIWDPDLQHAHSDATTDPRVEELLVAHLAGEPLPDRGWREDVTNAFASAGSGLVAAIEYALAAGTMGLSELLSVG